MNNTKIKFSDESFDAIVIGTGISRYFVVTSRAKTSQK